jgi:hypothetical protein
MKVWGHDVTVGDCGSSPLKWGSTGTTTTKGQQRVGHNGGCMMSWHCSIPRLFLDLPKAAVLQASDNGSRLEHGMERFDHIEWEGYNANHAQKGLTATMCLDSTLCLIEHPAV